ncbi:MAG: glycosyltransferase [Mogibacterium sp.]|nr:glycosyltransferase [Mogibacterium sp.]
MLCDKTNPTISIIVPVYRVEPYLRSCLDSVLMQTFTDWEMIIVDDGSTG